MEGRSSVIIEGEGESQQYSGATMATMMCLGGPRYLVKPDRKLNHVK